MKKLWAYLLSASIILLPAALTQAATVSSSTELVVLSSGGIMSALNTVAPGYEQCAGVRLNGLASPSMGNTPQAITHRLARHEPADVV